MKKEYETKYHSYESTHFWFRARRAHIVRLLKNADKNSKILDIGCSSGQLILDLVAVGFKLENIYGVDLSSVAIEKCKSQGITNAFEMDAQKLSLPLKFDIIIASDCLEHIQDDNKALAAWQKHLAKGGTLFVFVPAFNLLWSHHDEVNMHFRRYTSKELKNKISAQGLIVQETGYWNFILFLPVFFIRVWSKFFSWTKVSDSGDLERLSSFNSLLYLILTFENRYIPRKVKPFGVSAYCISRLVSD